MSYDGVLSSGEEVELFNLALEPEVYDAWRFAPELEICYCSIYESCWKLKTDQKDPVEIQSACQ